jgi:hypothetical protein
MYFRTHSEMLEEPLVYPNHTTIRTPKKIIQDKHRLIQPIILTKTIMRDIKTRKTSAPGQEIPTAVLTHSAPRGEIPMTSNPRSLSPQPLLKVTGIHPLGTSSFAVFHLFEAPKLTCPARFSINSYFPASQAYPPSRI